MQDIGWTPAGLSPPPPPSPPALPLPPAIPPTVIPPGYRLAGFGAGTGAGPNSAVTVNEALSLTQVGQFQPFGSNFTGGTRVATGDLNKDGVDDFVVGPGPGRATEVRVYSGVLTQSQIVAAATTPVPEPSSLALLSLGALGLLARRRRTA